MPLTDEIIPKNIRELSGNKQLPTNKDQAREKYNFWRYFLHKNTFFRKELDFEGKKIFLVEKYAHDNKYGF